MLSVAEFKEFRRIEEKLERGEELTADEQAFAKKYKIEGPKLCGYNGCTNKLGPRVEGEHRTLGDKFVCEECYFDSSGDVPNIGGRISRVHGCGSID